MREILFRGRRSWGNKEWVEGDVFHEYNGYVGISKKLLGIEMWEVDPETVGQYTGLKDKNGVKIFEGDILSAHLDDGYPENETMLEVVWHNNGWYVKNGKFFDDFDKGFEKYFEVIGNIHDNPELLK